MKRRILSVVLALVLLVSMAVPAFAISGSGTIANYAWEYYTSLSISRATGTMRYLGPSQCHAYINVYTSCWQHTNYGYVSNSVDDYGNATAVVAYPVVTVEDITHTCSPAYGYFTGKVGSQAVVSNAYFS